MKGKYVFCHTSYNLIMKKSLISTLLGLVMGLAFVTVAYAQGNLRAPEVFSGSSYITTYENNSSRFYEVQPRGNVISTGILQITNRGNGNIGVYIQTLTHTEVDSTTFGIYLDRWIESEQRWSTVANYKYTYEKEDNPDDDLTVKSISFDVVGQPVDCYYRLRGVHMVTSGEMREMLNSETDGILITKE